ncbi:hypothetical protein CK203_081535 [Vitis vinifera]|uniref:Integrase catalytic domain-containing protein n=1 Tax=Vitis vinifera TaxID=29760 RepID=A0A438DYC4_VITVI|nr:hypothetical protein CK203_081535 [Vitis vinifera]
MELKSWIFCRYGSPTRSTILRQALILISQPSNALTAIRLIPPVWISHNFKATTLGMTRKTMRNRGFEPWTFRSCLGYQHFVINDNNRDQRKKDSKKTSTATVAEIKTEANVAEKASALVAATDHGANGNTTPVIGEGSLTLTDTLNLDSVLVVPSLDYNLLMTWLCLMKTKDEVNLLFQNFHKMIETQYNAKVRVLRSDNGGEYQSSDLQKYLEGHASFIRLLVPIHPSKMESLNEKMALVRGCSCFLDSSKNTDILLGRSNHICRILDQSGTFSSINFQTPLQALTNV